MNNPSISIIVLTFNRTEEIKRNVQELLKIDYDNIEVIVVDNNSETSVAEIFVDTKRIKVLTMDTNIGVAGRNVGFREAKGDIVVSLDDDVFGLNDDSLQKLIQLFQNNPTLGAVNFKVIDDFTEEQIDWSHHCEIEKYSNAEFDTYEISEGAVAFSSNALSKTELYPEHFFISHEGPDLAFQLIKASYRVIYSPVIKVRHSHSDGGRVNWRRYYYDTRNQLWLVYRHLPLSMALKNLLLSWCSMFIYSIRDGYLKYWFKAVFSAILQLSDNRNKRTPLTGAPLVYVKSIEKMSPNIWYMIKKRLFRNKVRI